MEYAANHPLMARRHHAAYLWLKRAIKDEETNSPSSRDGRELSVRRLGQGAPCRQVAQDEGWRVSEPPCPKCHGFGFVSVWEPLDTTSWVGTNTISMRQCPNGCVVSMYYTHTSSTAASA